MAYNAFVYWGMKLFNLLFCLLFIISAGLQYNDPDPYVWIPIYGYGAVLCWLAFRGKYYSRACLAGILGVCCICRVFILYCRWRAGLDQ